MADGEQKCVTLEIELGDLQAVLCLIRSGKEYIKRHATFHALTMFDKKVLHVGENLYTALNQQYLLLESFREESGYVQKASKGV